MLLSRDLGDFARPMCKSAQMCARAIYCGRATKFPVWICSCLFCVSYNQCKIKLKSVLNNFSYVIICRLDLGLIDKVMKTETESIF